MAAFDTNADKRLAAARPLFERGWRYALVGLACALGNYSVMVAVDFAGGHYLLGIVVAALIVTPIGYALHSRFTFAEPFRLKAFARFAGSIAAAYPIAAAMMILLCSGLGLSVPIATPIAILALFLWNFATAHWAILPRFTLGFLLGSTAPQSDPDRGPMETK